MSYKKKRYFGSSFPKQVLKWLENKKYSDEEVDWLMGNLQRLFLKYGLYQNWLHEKPRLMVLLKLAIKTPFLPASTVKFAFRLLKRYDESWCTEQFFMALEPSDPETVLRKLKVAHRRIRKVFQERQKNEIKCPAYRPAINSFMAYLCYPNRPPQIEFGETYHSDGKRLYLPAELNEIRKPEGKITNQNHLFYLTLRGLIKWGTFFCRGTYDFSFEEEEGHHLLDEIADRRSTFDENFASWNGQKIFEKILSQDGWDTKKKAVLTHLEAFTLHFDNPTLLGFLIGIFEDIRAEAIVRKTGLADFSAYYRESFLKRVPHHAFLDTSQTFLSFLQTLCLDLPFTAPIRGHYKKLVGKAQLLADEYRKMPPSKVSPETSARFAMQLYNFMAQNLPEKYQKKLTEAFQQTIPSTLKEQLLGNQVAEMEAEEESKLKVPGRPIFRNRKETDCKGDQVDEYDYEKGEVLKNAVRINVEDFKPKRAPYPAVQLASFAFPNFSNHGRSFHSDSSYHLDYSGEMLAEHQLSDAVAQIAAGKLHPQKVYQRRESMQPVGQVTVLIDLSLSMEHRQKGLVHRPIQYAITATQKIVDHCRHHRIGCEVYGLIDGGRKPVNLLKVPLDQISKIHCVRAGGSRFGAAIRYLNHQKGSGSRLMIGLTDGSGIYISRGMDDLFRKLDKRCVKCMIRSIKKKGCWVETPEPIRSVHDQRSNRWGTYAEYQYADIGHAVDSLNPSSRYLHVELTKSPLRHVLDQFLYGSWKSSIGDMDLKQVG